MTSPAAKTPGRLVLDERPSTAMVPSAVRSSWPCTRWVRGSEPIATNMPVTSRVVSVPSSVFDQADAGDLLVAVDVGDLVVPDELDLRVGEGAVLHGGRGAQRVAAVHQVDLVGEPGEERGLFERGVAAADDRDLLLLEERAVAGGAPRDAVARQAGLVVEAELAVGGAGRVDDGEGLVHVAVADGDALDVAVELELGDVVVDDLGAEALGLLLHLHHQVGAHDALGEAGEVLDLGGLHQLAAELDGARDEQRLQVGARGVDRGGVARRTRSDDDDLAHAVSF